MAGPIRREHRWFHPIDWPQLSAVIRFRRARGRCEQCGRPHSCLVYHLGDGRWWDDETSSIWRTGKGRTLRRLAPPNRLSQPLQATRVFLACAHLDHNPGNNRPQNLKALCQRCHMLHDRAEHRRQWWLTLRRRKALGDLFLGLYR
jgi:hypothetical protein